MKSPEIKASPQFSRNAFLLYAGVIVALSVAMKGLFFVAAPLFVACAWFGVRVWREDGQRMVKHWDRVASERPMERPRLGRLLIVGALIAALSSLVYFLASGVEGVL